MLVHTFSSVAVVDRRGWLLMQERDEAAPVHPEAWGLPGGALEAGEDYVTGAVRELEEETGLTVPPEALTSLGRTRFHSGACGGVDEFELYVVHLDVTDADVTCGEGRQMVFVDPAVAFDRDLMPASRMQIPDVLDSEGYRTRFGGAPARRFACVALVDAQGAILMQERDEHPVIDPETWGLPGGHLEEGESFTEGAVRELAEETGVRLGAADLTLYGEFRVDHREAYGSHDRMRVFAAATSHGDDDVVCREGRQMVFLDPDRIRQVPLSAGAELVVPGFLDSDLYARLTG